MSRQDVLTVYGLGGVVNPKPHAHFPLFTLFSLCPPLKQIQPKDISFQNVRNGTVYHYICVK